MSENPAYEPIDQAPPDGFAEDDLVVGLPHLDLVAAELNHLGVTFDSSNVETDGTLNLALLKNLEGLRGRAAYARTGRTFADHGLTDLDALLLELRTGFAARFGGWTPELGKNRHVASIVPWAGPGSGKIMSGPGGGKIMAGALGMLAGTLGPVTYEAGPGGGKIMQVGSWVGGSPPVPLPSGLPSAQQVQRIVAHLGEGGGTVELWGQPSGFGHGVGDPEYVDPQEVSSRPEGTAGTGVRVGVLDMPLYPHPDLDAHLTEPHALFAGYEPDSDAVWRPMTGHATFVASVIASQAPGATIDVRAALDPEWGTTTAWQLAKAMASFAGTGVDVLNLSIGCRTADGQAPLVLATAVERLGAGTVVVAAAGNHAGSSEPAAPVWPAALPNVIAVGADSAEFSPRLPWVSLTAPGVDVLGAYVDAEVELSDGTRRRFDGWARWTGTSFAAATASGTIAANTQPGVKSARQAANEILGDEDPTGVVRPYRHV
jgi:hypothetical protein